MDMRRTPHRWSVTPRRARAIQLAMASAVRLEAPPASLRYIAGADLAFSPDGATCIAGVVLWDRERGQVLEERIATAPARFPYVPGLLSFREVPALLRALRRLRHDADAVMCDGHGLAHPRRFGLACHLGVLLDRPTLGCAKSRLTGTHRAPASARGARTALMDGSAKIGAVVRTRDGVKPVFVSVGHRMTLQAAVHLTLACALRYRLPEPTRLADRLVAQVKRERYAN
jgi:deoxyribonuclease V